MYCGPKLKGFRPRLNIFWLFARVMFMTKILITQYICEVH